MIPEKFVFLAALINFCATLNYVIATLRGRTRPNRVTWGMWALLGFIASAAQLAGGVGWSTLIVFMTGFGPALVFMSSFFAKKAYWKTSPFDYSCGVLSVCGLFGWYLTSNQDVAIGFAIFADFLAAIPTLRKAYTHPESENGWTFLIGVVSTGIGVLCVQQPTFTAYGFISYLVLINGVLAGMIFRRKLRKMAIGN